MNSQERLRRILAEATGKPDAVLRYEHVAFSIRVHPKTVPLVVGILRTRKEDIEQVYREASGDPYWTLPSYVCLMRARSVNIVMPPDTGLGLLARIVAPMLDGTDAKMPS